MTSNPKQSDPFLEPDWDPNNGGLVHLDHYKRCLFKGLRKAVAKQNNLIMVQAVQQTFEVNPFAFLEKIYQVY